MKRSTFLKLLSLPLLTTCYKIEDMNYSNYSNTINNSDNIVSFQSVQGATISQLSIIVKVTAGHNVYIDWGNGTSAQITANGADQTLTSNYVTNNTTYNIKIYGQVKGLTKWHLNNQPTIAGATSAQLKKFGLTYFHNYNSGTTNYIDTADFVDNAMTYFYLYFGAEQGGHSVKSEHFTNWNLTVFELVKAGYDHLINTADIAGMTGLTKFYLSYAGGSNIIDSVDFVNMASFTELYLNYIETSHVTIDSVHFADKPMTQFRIYRTGNVNVGHSATYRIHSSDFVGWTNLVYFYAFSLGANADVVINSADLVGLTKLFYIDHVDSGTASTYDTADLVNMAPNAWFYALRVGAVTGKISDFHATMRAISIAGGGTGMDITTGAMKAWADCVIDLLPTGNPGTGYTTAQIDGFLNAWATVAGSGSQIITLTGTNQPRSSASDAAVATLQGLGKTIYTNAA